MLDLLVHGHTKLATSSLVQVLRATHRVSLDQGCWDTAAPDKPRQDPQVRVRFRGPPAALETISAYKDALKKIQKREETGGARQQKNKEGDGQ
jgi:hypothetical protein